MRKITVIIALICFVAASPCFGQGFLKKALEKVEKGVNKVNESLESTQRNMESKPSQQSTDAKSNNAATASAERKSPNVITPYISDQTKTIYLNKGKMSINYDYNHFTDFSDGVAFVKDADKKLWATIDPDGNYLTKFLFNFDILKDLQYPFPRYDNGVCLE